MLYLKAIYKWCTKTRLRKVLSTILALLMFVTSIRFLFLKPTDVMADSLLGFNEGYGTTVNDNSGNITGTITNAQWKSEEFCKVGKCLYFDGTGDLINFGDDSDLDFAGATNFTLEGWFRTPDISSTKVLIAKHNSTAGGYKVYMDNSGYLIFGIDGDSSFTPADSVSSSNTSTALDDNKWHHFAAVKTGTTSISLYVDGILQQTDSSLSASGTLVNSDTFYIGMDGNGSSNGFSGFLDEVKVYTSSARSAAEIKADVVAVTASRGISASFGPSSDYLSSGLIAYYKMDESAANSCGTDDTCDSSGNSHNGAWSGNTTSAAGKFGNSIFLDGADDFVDTPSTNSLRTTTFAISVWTKVTSIPGTFASIINKYASDSDQSYKLYLTSSGIVRAETSFSGTNSVINSDVSVSDGNWHHLVYTVDNSSTQSIYIDGKLIITDSNTGTADTQVDSIRIGANASSANEFNGNIDDVRIYNRSLSVSEVINLYSWAPGPVGHWRFDENTGITAQDSSGNDNAGTLTNTPIWIQGKFGAALSFPDSNAHVLRNDDSDFDFGTAASFSFGGWFKHASASAQEMIIAKYDTGAGNGGFKLYMETDGDLTCGIDDDETSFPEDVASSTAATYDDSAWHHVMCVKDGTSSLKLYIDGVLITNNTTITSTGDFSNADPLYIGIAEDASSNDWVGIIDNIQIYNYARTAPQVVADMNGSHIAPGSPVGSATAYWKFDEGYSTTAYDGSINANNLTLSSTSWTNSGKFGKAWNGDGTNWVSIADNPDLDFSASEDFTISMWVKSDSESNPGGTEYVLSKAESSPGYRIYFSSAGDISFGIDEDSTWSPQDAVSSTSDIYDGTWHHVIAVKTGTSKIQLYVDGKLNAEDTSLAADLTLENSVTLYLGDRNGVNGGDEFNGDIDEVKVYRLALNPNQINAEYSQGSAQQLGAKSTNSSGTASWSQNDEYCPPRSSGTCTPPVAEWKMDENTGQTLQDTSGNSNTSTSWSGNTIYAPGKLGSGLYFDGSEDVVRINPTLTSLDDIGGLSDSYSVSAWFNSSLTGGSLSEAIVYKRKANTGAFPFSLTLSTSPRNVIFNASDGSTPCTSQTGGNVLANDGKWHFVSSVWETSTNTSYIYLDGVLHDIDVGCAATGSFANTDDISIGNGRSDSGGPGDYLNDDFNGFIDNVRIYNYARTQEQIAWEFNHGIPSVGWWKLDDNVGDAGTINDSTILVKNGTTSDGANNTGMDCTIAGKRNRGCDFDGVDDTISMGDQQIHQLVFTDGKNFSVAGWFNRDTFTTDDTIVGKKPNQNDLDNGWLIWVDDTDTLIFKANDSVDSYTVTSTTLFAATGWNHFVLVWDDDTESNIKMYINGKPEAVTKNGTLANIGSFTGTGRALRIGTESGGTSNPFDGKIDEIMLFGHALSDQEARNIYNQGSSVRFGPETGSP